MTTKEISDRLVALCREGRNIEAVDTLTSADIVSVEARGDETMPAAMSGRDAIRGKNEWWLRNHKIHSAEVTGPFPNGDRFAVIFNFVVTPVIGPMAGKKMRMEEVALYTVGDGKITREEFFYDMSGAGSPPIKKAAGKAPKKRAKKAARKTSAPKAKGKAKAKANGKTNGKTKTKARASSQKSKPRIRTRSL